MGRILATPYTTGDLMTWVDPSGGLTDFNGDAYLFLDGRKGFKSPPPFVTTESQTPLQDGTVDRFTLAAARMLDVPILVKGSNATDFEQVRRVLHNLWNPKSGKGKWRCTTPDGSQREINCKYDSGFDGDEAWGVASPVHMQAVPAFRAFDPYFYDVNATSFTATNAAGTPFFPITPVHLSSSSVLGAFSIFNGGDVEAFPVFTITGPGSSPVLTNTTTGKVISSSIALAGGQVLTIDTQAKTVKREDGSNQFSTLSFTSAFWTLAQGQNAITLSMGGTTAASQIVVSYKQRWLSL